MKVFTGLRKFPDRPVKMIHMFPGRSFFFDDGDKHSEVASSADKLYEFVEIPESWLSGDTVALNSEGSSRECPDFVKTMTRYSSG